jgi:hypothetical protein
MLVFFVSCNVVLALIIARRFVRTCGIGLHKWGPRVAVVVTHSGTRQHPFTHRCGNERRYCIRCGKNGALLNRCEHGTASMPR